MRSLWRAVQQVIDQVLSKTTLKDLLSNEQQMTSWTGHLVKVSPAPAAPVTVPVDSLQVRLFRVAQRDLAQDLH